MLHESGDKLQVRAASPAAQNSATDFDLITVVATLVDLSDAELHALIDATNGRSPDRVVPPALRTFPLRSCCGLFPSAPLGNPDLGTQILVIARRPQYETIG